MTVTRLLLSTVASWRNGRQDHTKGWAMTDQVNDTNGTTATLPTLADRLQAARAQFDGGREVVQQYYDDGDLETSERDGLLAKINEIAPEAPAEGAEVTEEVVALWEAALVTLRAKALELYDNGEVCCWSGLNDFASGAGLVEYESSESRRASL